MATAYESRGMGKRAQTPEPVKRDSFRTGDDWEIGPNLDNKNPKEIPP